MLRSSHIYAIFIIFFNAIPSFLFAQDKPETEIPIISPDRPGWGVEMDMQVLGREDYVHWQRKTPRRADGSTAYV